MNTAPDAVRASSNVIGGLITPAKDESSSGAPTAMKSPASLIATEDPNASWIESIGLSICGADERLA